MIPLRETPVLIIGGGPVGLALAADLGWHGIECVLVEQTDGRINTPKMNEVNLRTMEFCRRWGIADKVMNCPFPDDHPMDAVFVTSLGGYELARMERPAQKTSDARTAQPDEPADMLANMVRSDVARTRAVVSRRDAAPSLPARNIRSSSGRSNRRDC